MSSEYFDLFIEFMSECTSYQVVQANRTRLNKILRTLFQLVDSTGTGLLTRRRVVTLLAEFARAQAAPGVKAQLRNPLEWPMLDPCIKFEDKLAAKERTEVGENEAEHEARSQELPDAEVRDGKSWFGRDLFSPFVID